MIRRSPAEIYIKYLVLHPKKYSNAQIREILQFVQLDYLGDWYVNRLRQKVEPPDPFYPQDKAHKPSYRFLLSNELSWLFHPDEHAKRAFRILEKPRVKEFVESMIATNAPHVAISLALTRQYRFECTSKVIDRYRNFFWNVDLLDSTELRAILQLRVDQLADHANPEVKGQHAAVKNAFWKDPRRTAAGLPFSPLSALISQMQMGMAPSKLDLAKVLTQTQNMVAVRTYEAASNNGKGDSGKAFDYAVVLEKLTNTLEQIVKPDANLRDQLAAIAMRTDDVQIPSIHTLSLGQHTTEVTPLESSHDLSADLDEGDGGEGPPVDTG